MWLTRGYCWWRWDFQARFLANRWSILIDLRSRIPMVVVSTDVNGWRGRIDDLKLRWPATFAAFFRPDEAVQTMKTTGVLVYSREGTFLWWCGGLRRPEMGDRRRERESPARGERCSEISYGVNARIVHWCLWTLCTIGSQMKRLDGCYWLDLQGDWMVQIVWVLIWCDAVHRKLGTPGDVAQRDQILDYFNGWDVLGCVWYFSNCFFRKQYPTLVKKN